MFNNKRIKQLEKEVEDLKEYLKDLVNGIVPCRDCACLINEDNAYKVKTTYSIVSPEGFIYYCHKCKPNYDKIDNNHIKWNKGIKVK